MAESRILTSIRRALAGLPDAELLIQQQAGLVMRLCHAASALGESVEDVASALAIGVLEVRQHQETSATQGYEPLHLAVLRAARALGLRQVGGTFTRRSRSALADYLEDMDGLEKAHLEDDPAAILEACEAFANLDQVLVSSHLASADADAICTSRVAGMAGITTRAARYRKAKARAAAASGQGDLFGGMG